MKNESNLKDSIDEITFDKRTVKDVFEKNRILKESTNSEVVSTKFHYSDIRYPSLEYEIAITVRDKGEFDE